ncbi:MAG: CHAT domain-containing protein [Bacteroidia bacterium]
MSIVLTCCTSNTKHTFEVVDADKASIAWAKAKQMYENQIPDSFFYYSKPAKAYYLGQKQYDTLLNIYSISATVAMMQGNYRLVLQNIHAVEELYPKLTEKTSLKGRYRTSLTAIAVYTMLHDYQTANKHEQLLLNIINKVPPARLDNFYNNVGVKLMLECRTIALRKNYLSSVEVPALNIDSLEKTKSNKNANTKADADTTTLIKAHRYLHEGLNLRLAAEKQKANRDYLMSESYNNLTDFFLENPFAEGSRLDSAHYYLEKCKIIREKLFAQAQKEKDTLSISRLAKGITECFFHEGRIAQSRNQPVRALGYYRKSIQLQDQYPHPDAEAEQDFWAIVQTFSALKQYDSALLYCNKIIALYDSTQSYKGLSEFPSAKRLVLERDRLVLVEALYTKLSILEKSETQLNDNVALNAYLRVINVFDSLQSLSNDPSILFLIRGKRHEVQEKFLEKAYQMYETKQDADLLTLAFKSTESTLAFSIENTKQIESDNIPDSILLEEEHLLQSEVLSFTDSSYQRYLVFLKKLKQSFPAYYARKYAEAISIETVKQKFLAKDQALLQYFLGKKKLFIFAITPTKTIWKAISIDSVALVSQVQSLAQADLNNAHSLFSTLFPPVIYQQLPKRLMIVRDGILHYVLFDVLLTHPPKDSQNYAIFPYLLKEKVLSFLPSANFLSQLQERKPIKNTFTWLGVAPTFEGNNALNNVDEIREYAVSTPSWKETLVLTGEKATPQYFEQQIPKANIIHLNTHAEASQMEESASFDFGKYGKIPFQNIYHWDLIQVYLFIADACKTGDGTYYQGSGLMSLGNSLLAAGARSVLVTKMKIKPEDAREVLQSFYTELKQGKAKDVALATAKRAYLEKYAEKNINPLHWAAFELAGETTALPEAFWQKNSTLYYVITIIVILLIVVALGYSYYQRKVA